MLASSAPRYEALALMSMAELRRGRPGEAKAWAERLVRRHPQQRNARKLLAVIALADNSPEDAISALQPTLTSETLAADGELLLLAGRAYLEQGERERGLALIRRAARMRPEDPQWLTRIAVNQLGVGFPGEGARSLEQAIGIAPHDPAIRYLHIITLYMQGQLSESLEAAAALTAERANDPIAHNLLGTVLVRAGEPARARQQFSRAVALDPTFTPPRLHLARLLEQQGRHGAATRGYARILDIDGKHPDALLAQARLAERTGDRGRALALLKKAVTHNPNAFKPRVALAGVLLKAGRTRAALPLAARAVELAPRNTAARVLLGRTELLAGTIEAARASLTAALALDPDHVDARYLLGLAHLEAGDTEHAITALDHLLEHAPDHAPALLARAKAALRGGDTADAVRRARQLQRSPPSAIGAYLIEGDAHLTTARFDEAIVAYRRANALAPSRTTTVRLFNAYRRSDQSREAQAVLMAWLETAPTDVSMRVALGDYLHALGDSSGAITQYERATEQAPDHWPALNNLAWAYHQRGGPQARPLAARAVELAPGAAASLDTYGWILLEHGELQQAKALLLRAYEAAPDFPSIAYHYAVALTRTNDPREAKRVLQPVLDNGEHFPERKKALALLRGMGRN